MTDPAPRTFEQRKQDTLARLEKDVDAWIATAGDEGPYLVPLSYLWDGATVLLATPARSATGRNLDASQQVRLGIGATRDVVLVEGVSETIEVADLPTEVGDAFAAHTGFEPRTLRGYRFFRVTPQRIQAWREVDELAGRDLMRDGTWLA
ncbi:pyridoxamine 5'-phosphate oxidase family protein [Luteipulveratus mongoliensis]|uniref:Pyridoxamine 5'-phosphate oxidase n=1 Tax=Luteipulveratus mongoliensis TaxID=571913 RepID=A0A0K1JGJ5_9MICO|nr:pyridoxamine 5'-phosphate oxidase family protein [Luteipulveratus mongoliensis]AKU15831.1 pyridoxamine 5'-phosphate oxidase [Luteipulveratus mongoliensis]